MVIYIVQEMDINLVEEEGIVVEAEMVEYGEVVVVVDMAVMEEEEIILVEVEVVDMDLMAE